MSAGTSTPGLKNRSAPSAVPGSHGSTHAPRATSPGQRAGNCVPALKPGGPSNGGTLRRRAGQAGSNPASSARGGLRGPPVRGIVPRRRVPTSFGAFIRHAGNASSHPAARLFDRPRHPPELAHRAPLRQSHGAPKARSFSGPGWVWVTRPVGRAEGERRFRRASGIPCHRPGIRARTLGRVSCSLVPVHDPRSGYPGPAPTGFPVEARSPRRQRPTCRAQSFRADLCSLDRS